MVFVIKDLMVAAVLDVCVESYLTVLVVVIYK